MEDVLEYDDDGAVTAANLDVKNPNAGDEIEHRPPEELIAEIVKKERRILALMDEIAGAMREGVIRDE